MRPDDPTLCAPASRRWKAVWDTVLDLYLLAPLVAGAGLVAGWAWGWFAGVIVAAGVIALLWGIQRAAKAIIRKSQQTQVTQRRFPRPRS